MNTIKCTIIYHKLQPLKRYWFSCEGLLWVSLTPQYKLHSGIHAFILRRLSTRWILGVKYNGVEAVNLQPGLIAMDLWEEFPLYKCSVCGLKLIMFYCGERERLYGITLTFSKDGWESNRDTSDHYKDNTEEWLKLDVWVYEKGFTGKRDKKMYCLGRVKKTRGWVNQNQIRWPLIPCRNFPPKFSWYALIVFVVFLQPGSREIIFRRVSLIVDKRSEKIRSRPVKIRSS